MEGEVTMATPELRLVGKPGGQRSTLPAVLSSSTINTSKGFMCRGNNQGGEGRDRARRPPSELFNCLLVGRKPFPITAMIWYGGGLKKGKKNTFPANTQRIGAINISFRNGGALPGRRVCPKKRSNGLHCSKASYNKERAPT